MSDSMPSKAEEGYNNHVWFSWTWGLSWSQLSLNACLPYTYIDLEDF